MSRNWEEPGSDEFGQDGNGIGFEWDDDQLSDEQMRMVDEVCVPVDKRLSKEMQESIIQGEVDEIQCRLKQLRVVDWRTATRWQARQNQDLFFIPYAIEDVHYDIYDKKRQASASPYVSVNFKEIIIASKNATLPHLQRTQTHEAYFGMVDLGLKHSSFRELASSSSQGDKFLVRSLYRVLKEDYLSDLTAGLPNENYLRGISSPITFEEVVERSISQLATSFKKHGGIEKRGMSKDELAWHGLERRKLDRAAAFLAPLAERFGT